jgi:CheY-like chemotaxis protein
MASALHVLRVLVVEDDDDNAETTSLLLRMLGHETEVAYSGETALEKAPSFVPDLMLIDLAMPRFDGFELENCFRLIPAFNKTPMIAVSGYVDALHRQQAFEAGFDGFLGKPFTKDDLAEVCDRVVRASPPGTTASVGQPRTARRELSPRSRFDFWINSHGIEDPEFYCR